jgi:hypothetical protein
MDGISFKILFTESGSVLISGCGPNISANVRTYHFCEDILSETSEEYNLETLTGGPDGIGFF